MKRSILKTVSKGVKMVGKKAVEHSPAILTSLGVAGLVGSVVFAIVATPEAMRRIGKRKRELQTEELPVIEVVKAAGPVYVPTLISTAASATCIIASNKIQTKRATALTTAYLIAEQTLTDYQKQISEDLGKNQSVKIRDRLAAKKVKENPPKADEVVETGTGTVLCYDSISGRYFYSNIESIDRAIINLNNELIDDGFISQNDLFYELGLKPTGSGYELGWSRDSGKIVVNYSSTITEKGNPCIVLQYPVEPKYKYYHS